MLTKKDKLVKNNYYGLKLKLSILSKLMKNRSMDVEGELKFAVNFSVDADMAQELGMVELLQAAEHLKRTMKQMSINNEEYVLLKAISLLNSG